MTDRAGHPNVAARPALPPEWAWIVLLGAGMALGGCLAGLVAVTRVVLPYDEAFVGLSRADLAAVSTGLLLFLTHDRVTLAGSMISIGVLYSQLALGGVLFANGLGVLLASLWGYRNGARWLWWTMLGSGVPGFIGTLGIHVIVGYTDSGHLAPALAGAGLYAAGLFASYPALCRATAT